MSMDLPPDRPLLRIGELSRRVGVSDHVLRSWESRYGLLWPVRSAGGFRLYSEEDESRIRRMQAYLAAGLSAGEAARLVLREDGFAGTDAAEAAAPRVAPAPASDLSAALRKSLDALDEPGAQLALDRLLSDLSLTTVLRDVIVPYLAELGDRWERGTASIGQEHFASNIIRGRLAGLARGWGSGHGPRALLACPPGELHDMGLVIFGIVLNRNGWRVDYFGMDTPVAEVARCVEAVRPALVVLATTTPQTLEPVRAELAAVARLAPLAFAGAGATPEIAAAVGARLMVGDPVTEAEQVAWSSS
jgi:DNA-binding transcriptional MerR regulator